MYFNDGQHCWHHMHFKLFIGVFYCSEVVQVVSKFQINICVKHTINQYQRGVGCYHSIFNMAQSFEEARWPLAEDTVLRSWARHLTVTVPLSIQEYTWVPANCWGKLTNCGGVTCDGLATRLRGVEILLAASCYRAMSQSPSFWEIFLVILMLHSCYRAMSQSPSFSKIFLVTLMTKLAFSQHHLLGISQGNNTSRESRLARELKGAEILHSALEEYEKRSFIALV